MNERDGNEHTAMSLTYIPSDDGYVVTTIDQVLCLISHSEN